MPKIYNMGVGGSKAVFVRKGSPKNVRPVSAIGSCFGRWGGCFETPGINNLLRVQLSTAAPTEPSSHAAWMLLHTQFAQFPHCTSSNTICTQHTTQCAQVQSEHCAINTQPRCWSLHTTCTRLAQFTRSLDAGLCTQLALFLRSQDAGPHTICRTRCSALIAEV